MRKFIDIITEGEVVYPKFGRPVDKVAKLQGGASIHKFAARPDMASLDAFTRGYIGAALQLADEELGDDAFYEKLHVDTISDMIEDCRAFQAENAADLGEYYDHGLDEEQAGIDFWLTRNGHGAGFWDRGAGDAGKRLSAASKKYGETDLYLGDDGAVYAA